MITRYKTIAYKADGTEVEVAATTHKTDAISAAQRFVEVKVLRFKKNGSLDRQVYSHTYTLLPSQEGAFTLREAEEMKNAA